MIVIKSDSVRFQDNAERIRLWKEKMKKKKANPFVVFPLIIYSEK